MTTKEYGFKAEVQQLLDLMIHSIYSDKEVFLRELVSNSADALDKVRFIELTRLDLNPAVGEGIRITVDPEAKTIAIEDDGIGMTEEEVITNLGTIAHSGTEAFLNELKEKEGSDKVDLIGQFGVGFYSAFMVAKSITVDTLSAYPDSTAVRWVSTGTGNYTIEPSERAHRGTRVLITLRDEAEEYSEEHAIKHIVQKHSNYLSWPILVNDEKANEAKALWAESPSNVSAEEANAFYKSLAMDWTDPEHRIHLKVDSPIQYSAMLFIPGRKPSDLFHPEADRGPRLYARRVMILEHAKEILPDWLRFVRGVVDSEDIQLNVSREMVQKTPIVRKIRDALTKRVLKEMTKLAKSPADQEVEEGEVTKHQHFLNIWRNFGAVLKEGYFHAREHRDGLLPLMRFNAASHTSDDALMSLAEYKEAMPEGQDAIWYITAPSREAALLSPHLEVFKKRGWDVLLLTDTVDEWFANELDEFDGLSFKSVARGEIDLEDSEEDEEAASTLSGVSDWMTELFASELAGVRSSNRLTDSACVLVDDEAGISSNMERILRAAQENNVMSAKRYLELNPAHPIVKNLVMLKEKGQEGVAEPIARLLLDDALLLEGTVKDPAGIGRRIEALLEQASSAALAIL